MIPSGRDPAQSSFRHVGEMKGFTRQGRSWPPGRTLRSRRGHPLSFPHPPGLVVATRLEERELCPLPCRGNAGTEPGLRSEGGARVPCRAWGRQGEGPAAVRTRRLGARLRAHETPRLPTCLFFPLGSYVFKRRCCLPFLYLVYTAASGTKGF